jgi:hypothetical protein
LKYENKWHTLGLQSKPLEDTKTMDSAGILVGIHGRSGALIDALGFFFGLEPDA